jgi:uncharacterized protein YggU (UPF0235/DUF167 family)
MSIKPTPAPGRREPARIELWVRPGSSRTVVGGEHDGALLVVVAARAVGGAATTAAMKAVARALGVHPRQVHLLRGATSRRKVIQVSDPPPDLDRLVDHLRGR